MKESRQTDAMDTSSNSPRGTKRTADDAQFVAAQIPKKIKVQGQYSPKHSARG